MNLTGAAPVSVLTPTLYFAQIHGNRVTPGQGRTFVVTLGVVY
jgi:hypothetical protein